MFTASVCDTTAESNTLTINVSDFIIRIYIFLTFEELYNLSVEQRNASNESNPLMVKWKLFYCMDKVINPLRKRVLMFTGKEFLLTRDG